MQYYDLVGDLHGHADELIKLLLHLGYRESPSGYRHDSRQVIFLGDFIDRGEHLQQHRQLLDIVMAMVDNGHALAVMGNHEFNALAYHTLHQGDYLRPRTAKNTQQHQAFLNEFDSEPELKQKVLDFFCRLPLWLELEGLRVIHACWDEASVAVMRRLAPSSKLNSQLLVEAATQGNEAFAAIEILLKGVEVPLPNGVTFKDKDGHPRDAVRIQWWNRDATQLGDTALPLGVDIGAAAALPIPVHLPRYGKGEPPCFVGHYWLSGSPAPLASNVACLDYSVAKQGKLVAYRWSGEQSLTSRHFTHI